MTVTSAYMYIIDYKAHLKYSFYHLVRLYFITKKEDIRISKLIKIIFEQLKL